MSITVKAELSSDTASARLQALIDRMGHRLEFFEAVGVRLVRSSSDNFRKESGPDGQPWTPLKPATIRARQAKKQLPLTILRSNSRGKAGSPLAGSVSHEATEEDVRVGSPKTYAAIHQLGGTIRKAAGSRWMAGRRFAKRDKHPEGSETAIKAHSITIPARPFIGIGPADEAGILEAAEDWLTR